MKHVSCLMIRMWWGLINRRSSNRFNQQPDHWRLTSTQPTAVRPGGTCSGEPVQEAPAQVSPSTRHLLRWARPGGTCSGEPVHEAPAQVSPSRRHLLRWARAQLCGFEHSVIIECVCFPILSHSDGSCAAETCGSVDGGHHGCLKRRTVDTENWTFKNWWTDRCVFIFQQTELNLCVSHYVTLWCWSKVWQLSGTTRPNKTSELTADRCWFYRTVLDTAETSWGSELCWEEI